MSSISLIIAKFMEGMGDLIYWGAEQIFYTTNLQYFEIFNISYKHLNPSLNIKSLNLSSFFLMLKSKSFPEQFSLHTLTVLTRGNMINVSKPRICIFLYLIFWICIWYLKQGRDWYSSLLKHHVDWFILGISHSTLPCITPSSRHLDSQYSLGSF